MKLFSSKNIRVVAFDVEGTLLPSTSRETRRLANVEGMLVLRERLGCDPNVCLAAMSELYEKMASTGYLMDKKSQFRYMLRKVGIQEDEEAISQAYERCLKVHLIHDSLYSDVIPLLNQLQSKYKVGFFTDGPEDLVFDKIMHMGVNPSNAFYMSAQTCKAPITNTKFYQRLCKIAKAPPEMVLVVTHNVEQIIKTAKRSGLWTAWVLRNIQQRKVEQDADIQIRSLTHLVRYL